MVATNTIGRRKLILTDPRPELIFKEDILYSLAGLNRYIAHTNPYWPVLRHSLVCAIIAEALGNDKPTCLVALFHDTAEAYFGDMHGPLKEWLLEDSKRFVEIEAKVERAIAAAMNLPTWFAEPKNPLRGYVKHLDYLAYHGEVVALDLQGFDLRKVPVSVEAILVNAVNQVKNLDTPALLSLWETMEGRFRS